MLIPAAANLRDLLDTGERLNSALNRPFEIEGVKIAVEASIGVVISGTHGDEASMLMQRADMAMYAAKKLGHAVGVYQEADGNHSLQRLSLLSELRRAMENNELFLHYQPKIDILSGKINGVEALVRWHHPVRGLLGPEEFIPFAENSGLIGNFTHHILNMAMAQCKAWSLSSRPLTVAVNISARNLLDETLVSQVSALLKKHNLLVKMLEFEVTESAIMLDPIKATKTLAQLSAMGIRISIDDFGAGYTSLAQLKNLPITQLKIDKSFVQTMHEDRSNAIIVHSVINLGHSLGLNIVAEGVESAAAMKSLRQYGCDTAQGYHLCFPMLPEILLVWMKEREVNASSAKVLV